MDGRASVTTTRQARAPGRIRAMRRPDDRRRRPGARKPAAKDAKTLKAMALAFMHKLVSLPERVKRYF